MGVKSIVATVLSFFLLDMVWINVVAVKLYKKHLSHLLAMKDGAVATNIPAALCFYVVACFALVYLVVRPAHSVSEAAINGAIVGLFAYGTYAFTCQALFKNWLWSVTIPDVVWGVVLCAVSCAIGTYLKS
jgi:uncharacterized membrane protein